MMAMLLPTLRVQAQTDTVFWFAAPDLAESHQQVPIQLCLTTYGEPATITIEQPANISFAPVTITLPADSFYVYDLSDMVDSVENTTANTVLNRGIRIGSTGFVSCYYESVGNNSEVYTLKGMNALGREFLVPMQMQLDSESGHGSYSSIEIVATEDSTVVEITSPVALQGGIAAGSTLTVMLNRGQSYVVRAAGQGAADHLGGMVIRSNKDIAVNSSDDSVSSGMGCVDLIGEQLVPTELLGSRYVAIRNENENGFERVFVYPTENNTTVQFNGGLPMTVSPGGFINWELTDTATLIEADKPIAVWQMTATGCELGGTMLPHMECTGSFSVSHLRPNIESMIVTIVVGTPYVSHFTVNGDPTIVTAADFRPLAEDTTLSYCLKDISSYVPMGTMLKIKNNMSRFQLGILDGNTSGSCSYGYYCDYARSSRLEIVADTLVCEGNDIVVGYSAVNVGGLTLTLPDGRVLDEPPFVIAGADMGMSGTYRLEGIDTAGCFRPVRDSIEIRVLTPTRTDTTVATICVGRTYTFYDTTYNEAGTYQHHVAVEGEVCDSLNVLVLKLNPGSWSDTVTTACDSLVWRGAVYDSTGYYLSLPVGINSDGCDSMRRLNLTVHPSKESTDSIVVCPGFPYVYNGIDYGGPVTLDTLLTTMYGCDSLVHVTLYGRDSSYRVTTLYSFDSIEWFVIDSTLAVCAPTTLYLRDSTDGSVSRLWSIRTPDTTFTTDDSLVVVRLMNGYDNMVASIQVTVMSAEGCIDTVEYPLYIFSSPKADFYWDPYIPARHNPEVQFFNRSEPDGLTYLWRIPRVAGGEYDTSTRFEPSYHWGSESDNMTGEYTVDLIAYWTHYYNDTMLVCTDTSTQTIVITDDYLQFPNLVTPDGDGNNDIWKIVNLLEYGVYPMNELWIYNAWGVLVYHVKNIHREEQFWDPAATYCPDGTYYYRFMAISEYGRIKRNGLIEVISGD